MTWDEWPLQAHLYIYDEWMCLIDESEDRKYDLNDNLFQVWHEPHRTVYLGMTIANDAWCVWDEQALKEIEDRIVFDLEFDGNDVFVTRHTQETGRPCTEEFVWRLDIQDG